MKPKYALPGLVGSISVAAAGVGYGMHAYVFRIDGVDMKLEVNFALIDYPFITGRGIGQKTEVCDGH